MSDGEQLHEKWVQFRRVASSFEQLSPLNYDVTFISVGPRNTTNIPLVVEQLECPIFSLENDPTQFNG